VSQVAAAIFVITREEFGVPGRQNIQTCCEMVLEWKWRDQLHTGRSQREANFSVRQSIIDVLIDAEPCTRPFRGVNWDTQDVPLEDWNELS